MSETAETEATIEEIVVALCETREDADRLPPFTVIDGGQPGDNSGSLPRDCEGAGAGDHSATAAPEVETGDGSTDVGDLRDDEIKRLSTEIARLNERIMFLLKVIGREQARIAENAAVERDRGMISRDLKAAIEAEFRPFLLVLMRLLEKQRSIPAAESSRRAPVAARLPSQEMVLVPRSAS